MEQSRTCLFMIHSWGLVGTALACISLGVNYIGTEIDPEYIKIAQQQISGDIKTYLQGDEEHNW